MQAFYKVLGKTVETTFKDLSDETVIGCYEMLKYCEQRNSPAAIELKNKYFYQMYEQDGW